MVNTGVSLKVDNLQVEIDKNTQKLSRKPCLNTPPYKKVLFTIHCFMN